LIITTIDRAHTSQESGSNFHHGMSPAGKTATVNKVDVLEQQLFDGEGHLRRGMTPERATNLLDQINVLRHELGWLHLDLHHRPVWPDDLPQ
jgi:hypothetical protein